MANQPPDQADGYPPLAFAAALFGAVLLVAVVAEIPLATVVGRPVSFAGGVRNGVIAGCVFGVIYLLGTAVTRYRE